MTKLKTILKRGTFNTVAYIYRNGVHIVQKESFRKTSVEVNYWLPKEIGWSDPDLARIVIHSAEINVLPFGIPEKVSTYLNNSSPARKNAGIEARLVILHYSHGGRFNFEEIKLPNSADYYSSEITAQGRGVWADNWGYNDWNDAIENGFNPDLISSCITIQE